MKGFYTAKGLELAAKIAAGTKLVIEKVSAGSGTGNAADLGPGARDPDYASLRIPGWQGHREPLPSFFLTQEARSISTVRCERS